jgi:hypothetical protein
MDNTTLLLIILLSWYSLAAATMDVGAGGEAGLAGSEG